MAPDDQDPSDVILHQDEVEEVIEEVIEESEGITLIEPAANVPALGVSGISNHTTTHALNATFSDTEVETALNNLGTKVNQMLVQDEFHRLIINQIIAALVEVGIIEAP